MMRFTIGCVLFSAMASTGCSLPHDHVRPGFRFEIIKPAVVQGGGAVTVGFGEQVNQRIAVGDMAHPPAPPPPMPYAAERTYHERPVEYRPAPEQYRIIRQAPADQYCQPPTYREAAAPANPCVTTPPAPSMPYALPMPPGPSASQLASPAGQIGDWTRRQ